MNAKGQALVQVLVASAILGILMAAFSTMLSMHQTENRRLSDNLAKMDLERVLTSDLQDGTVCTYLLTTPVATTFDPLKVKTANPPEFPFNSVPVSGVAGSPDAIKKDPAHSSSSISPNLFTKSITIKDLACVPALCAATTSLFTANLVIEFDNTKLVSAVSSLSLPVTFKTLPVGPLQKVDVCLGSGSSGGPGGPVVIGPVNYPGAHAPGCAVWKVPPYNTMTVQVWGAGAAGRYQWYGSGGGTSSFGSVIATGGIVPPTNMTPIPGNGYGGDTIPGSDPPVADPASNIQGNIGTTTNGGNAPGPGGGAGGFIGTNGGVPGGGGGPGRGGSVVFVGASGGYAKRTFQPGDLAVGSYVNVCVGAGGVHSPGTPSYVPGDGGNGDVRININ